MDALTEKVLAKITELSPNCSWQELIDSVEYSERQKVLSRVTALALAGQIGREVKRVDGKNTIRMWIPVPDMGGN